MNIYTIYSYMEQAYIRKNIKYKSACACVIAWLYIKIIKRYRSTNDMIIHLFEHIKYLKQMPHIITKLIYCTVQSCHNQCQISLYNNVYSNATISPPPCDHITLVLNCCIALQSTLAGICQMTLQIIVTIQDAAWHTHVTGMLSNSRLSNYRYLITTR